jgi:hypothetical protein
MCGVQLMNETNLHGHHVLRILVGVVDRLQGDADERDGCAERDHACVRVGLGILRPREKTHWEVVQGRKSLELRWESTHVRLIRGIHET